MIQYRTDKYVDYGKLIILFNQAGWNDKTRDMNRLKAMVENSQVVVTAWDGEEMVGFARCTTDFVFNGQINNVVVDPACRKKGIGRTMIDKILGSSGKVTYILRSETESMGFYKGMGFTDDSSCMVYKRKE
jgi:ribosomal protein S18 acetylase RimI-like enzyme